MCTWLKEEKQRKRNQSRRNRGGGWRTQQYPFLPLDVTANDGARTASSFGESTDLIVCVYVCVHETKVKDRKRQEAKKKRRSLTISCNALCVRRASAVALHSLVFLFLFLSFPFLSETTIRPFSFLVSNNVQQQQSSVPKIADDAEEFLNGKKKKKAVRIKSSLFVRKIMSRAYTVRRSLRV